MHFGRTWGLAQLVLIVVTAIGLIDSATTAIAAIAALIGGIVLFGSNNSTLQQARAALRAAEAERAMLIGRIELRVVDGGRTLH